MTKDYSGSTIVVTGASSGLGAEFARQLAARGARVVLVARRATRLDALAAEIGGGALPIAADLTKPGAAGALGAELRERGIAVDGLVNNAGFATRNLLQDEDPARIADEVQLNVGVLVDLTREFYPGMRASGRGLLINVASTAAYQPVPKMATYGATKAFVLSFTEALWVEAKSSSMSVLALSPGATRTEFFDVAGGDAQVGSMRTSEAVVALALKTLDKRNPPPSVISGTSNWLTTLALRFFSRRVVANMAGAVTGR